MKNIPEFRERLRDYQRKYRLAHIDKIREKSREWSRRNPKRERLLRKIDEYIEILQGKDS